MAVSAPNSSSQISIFKFQSFTSNMTLPPSSSFHGFQQKQQSKHIIKGPRPSPLMINTNSHAIRKPSSSTTAPPYHTHHQQIRKPIIIYTHSPKIIHTKPEDFKALIQKLTGMPRPKEEKDVAVFGAGAENLESSLSDESIISNNIKQEKNGAYDVNNEITSPSSSAVINRYGTADEAVYLNYDDIPLFTPNSSDFLIGPYSNRSVFKQSADSPFGILGSLISPSGLEFIKELPEY